MQIATRMNKERMKQLNGKTATTKLKQAKDNKSHGRNKGIVETRGEKEGMSRRMVLQDARSGRSNQEAKARMTSADSCSTKQNT
jgi:hypothetical protein